MLRRFFQMPTDDAPDETDPTTSSALGLSPSGEPDLATLPIVGITRRRAAILLGALLAGWIIILFARQVSEASAATGRAATMVDENVARRQEIAGLEESSSESSSSASSCSRRAATASETPRRPRSRWKPAHRPSRQTPRVRPGCGSAPGYLGDPAGEAG